MRRRLLFKIQVITLLIFTNSFYCISQNTDCYNVAYSKIKAMLEENRRSFKEAVFTVENAYFDNNLDIEAIYKKIERYADFCIGIKESGNIAYNGTDRDRALMQYSVFLFFSEKIPILNGEQIDTVYPFAYNYEDFAGKADWSNMFVSTLMATKYGNCHSLPYLYKIIMDELGEQSYLSLCPNHLYIKAQNEEMGWYNIELTNGNFPTDAYLMSSGYVHIDAIRNGIYMNELTQQQSVALCLVDLAQGYIAKYGIGKGEFVLKCCETALEYFPDCITAMLLKSRVLAQLYKNSEAKDNEQFAELTKLTTKIHKLGYRKMPERMYQSWLNRIQSENRDLHITVPTAAQSQDKKKNPFAKYGLDNSKMIRSAAETVFEEFFDLDDTLQIGEVYFDIRNYKIVGFIPDEKLKTEIEVDLIALSVDPLCDLYWWISPYAYCSNNPINKVDPTGMSDHWVEGADGIYWDDNAKSPETTKPGEKYLGTETFGANAEGFLTHFRSDKSEARVVFEMNPVDITANKPNPALEFGSDVARGFANTLLFLGSIPQIIGGNIASGFTNNGEYPKNWATIPWQIGKTWSPERKDSWMGFGATGDISNTDFEDILGNTGGAIFSFFPYSQSSGTLIRGIKNNAIGTGVSTGINKGVEIKQKHSKTK